MNLVTLTADPSTRGAVAAPVNQGIELFVIAET